MEDNAIVEKALESKFKIMRKGLSLVLDRAVGLTTDWVQAFDMLDSFDDTHEAEDCIKKASEAFEKGTLKLPDGCVVEWVPQFPYTAFRIDVDIVDYFDKFISDEKLKALCKKRGINIA